MSQRWSGDERQRAQPLEGLGQLAGPRPFALEVQGGGAPGGDHPSRYMEQRVAQTLGLGLGPGVSEPAWV